MRSRGIILAAGLAVLAAACAKEKTGEAAPESAAPEGTGIVFKDDVAFLRQHTGVVVLSDAGGRAQVAVNPDLQGRVMTSTASGPDGLSFGWINRAAIASKETNLHMNAFGGEDRFWLGPEGGQFGIFFKKGDPFDLEHWFTPPPINEGAWDVADQAADRITFKKSMKLTNYSGTEFALEAAREVKLLDARALADLDVAPPDGIRFVAYASVNEIANTGPAPWTKETGLLSIWILGMFNPSPATTVVVPFKAGPAGEFGPVVNDAYFGKIPADRLVIDEARGVLFFKGDGLYRSKIGIPPRRAKSFLGSYDAASRTLTLVRIVLPEGAAGYVNSMWEIQKDPYAGDVVNSYNDGPPAPGAKPLGPFYELESSSPALALKPGEKALHSSWTLHFQGEERVLDALARATLGVGLDEVKHAFGAKN
jgi:hypothetical protein